MPQPILEAQKVGKTYPNGVRALAGVDIQIHSGETVALIGKSGCGKTTLLRLFNRLEEPTAGEIRIGGRISHEHDPIQLRRHTGYVQQEGGLLPHWSVERNVTLVPWLLGWETQRARERAVDLLALVGLDPGEYGARYPNQLSGGERQRVAFARALAADPPVILLDEPFGALDALTRLEMQEEFLSIKKTLGKSVVLVTHDLHEAFRLADRIAVMKDGTIHQTGVPRALEESPATDYVRTLVQKRQG
jgi:osmoprotectant transport system ATP-binding protein